MIAVLAAGPQLVRRWEHAINDYARAIITAAIDAHLMGVESPLNANLLRAATRDYLSMVQRGKAPVNWFEVGLAYATEELHGAASALVPVGAEIGELIGYSASDYLQQHGSRVRRKMVPPPSAWKAYAEYLTDANDLYRVALAAHTRTQYVHVEELYCRAVAAGSSSARIQLAGMWQSMGMIDKVESLWREGIKAGDPNSRAALASLLSATGRDDEVEDLLRNGVEAIDHYLLAERLQLDGCNDEAEREYWAAADAGFALALGRLAMLLDSQMRSTEAEQVLWKAVDAGEPYAISQIAERWHQEGRSEEAMKLLDEMARCNYAALSTRIRILQDQGREREAEDLCRLEAVNGHPHALEKLANLLLARGDIDGALLALRKGSAGPNAVEYTFRLVQLLKDNERFDDLEEVLREEYGHGNSEVTYELIDLLQRGGRFDEAEPFILAEVAAGDTTAISAWATNLIGQEKPVEAERMLRDGIREGNPFAVEDLYDFLKIRGRHDEADRLREHGIDPESRPPEILAVFTRSMDSLFQVAA